MSRELPGTHALIHKFYCALVNTSLACLTMGHLISTLALAAAGKSVPTPTSMEFPTNLAFSLHSRDRSTVNPKGRKGDFT